jgi:hypothetical protein
MSVEQGNPHRLAALASAAVLAIPSSARATGRRSCGLSLTRCPREAPLRFRVMLAALRVRIAGGRR